MLSSLGQVGQQAPFRGGMGLLHFGLAHRTRRQRSDVGGSGRSGQTGQHCPLGGGSGFLQFGLAHNTRRQSRVGDSGQIGQHSPFGGGSGLLQGTKQLTTLQSWVGGSVGSGQVGQHFPLAGFAVMGLGQSGLAQSTSAQGMGKRSAALVTVKVMHAAAASARKTHLNRSILILYIAIDLAIAA